MSVTVHGSASRQGSDDFFLKVSRSTTYQSPIGLMSMKRPMSATVAVSMVCSMDISHCSTKLLKTISVIIGYYFGDIEVIIVVSEQGLDITRCCLLFSTALSHSDEDSTVAFNEGCVALVGHPTLCLKRNCEAVASHSEDGFTDSHEIPQPPSSTKGPSIPIATMAIFIRYAVHICSIAKATAIDGLSGFDC